MIEEAFARLGQGRCLLALCAPAEARQPLTEARDIFASLAATPALADAAQLLAQAAELAG